MLKLPAASVAFHVLLITFPVVTSVLVIVMIPSILSVAVALPVTDIDVDVPQFTLILAGQVITGFTRSAYTEQGI